MQVQRCIVHRPSSAVFFTHETPTDGFWKSTKQITSDVTEQDENVWTSNIGRYLQGMLLAKKKYIQTSYQIYLKNYLTLLIEKHLTKVRKLKEVEKKSLLQTNELLSSLLELQQIEKDLERAKPSSLYLVLPLIHHYEDGMSKLALEFPPPP